MKKKITKCFFYKKNNTFATVIVELTFGLHIFINF